MIKIMCFLKRKPGMSLADFRDYYENHHAPMAERLVPFYVDYNRNFRCETQDYAPGHLENKVEAEEPSWDVITELTFATQEDYQKNVDALSDPVIGAQFVEDEEKLFDRSKMVIYLVDEFKSATRIR